MSQLDNRIPVQQVTKAKVQPPEAGLNPVLPRMEAQGQTPAPAQPQYSTQGQSGTPPTFTPAAETSAQSQTPEPPSAPQPEKVYTYAELEEYQQGLTAEDKELWKAGEKFYRNSRYTATPNERTIKLERPIYGDLWYYDPGERIYEGQSTPAQMGESGGVPGTQRPGPGGSSTSAPADGSSDLTSLLEEWKKAAAEQANGQIDYAVSQAITELERALADAQGQFKEQAESVALDERQALDNSALYAEMRGDKGGIGQSQYNEIQAAAAQNRLAVQQAQTKLSTDTARQIADLRAQGEFEKADKLLEITQTYLSQLISLEQWAAEFGLSQQQFQASLQQWQAEYELALGEFEHGVSANQQSQTADLAYALLSAGVELDDGQLAALGMSRDQMYAWLRQRELEQAAGSGGGTGGGGSGAESELDSNDWSRWTADQIYAELAKKHNASTPASIIKNDLRDHGITNSGALNDYYDAFVAYYNELEAANQQVEPTEPAKGIVGKYEFAKKMGMTDAQLYFTMLEDGLTEGEMLWLMDHLGMEA